MDTLPDELLELIQEFLTSNQKLKLHFSKKISGKLKGIIAFSMDDEISKIENLCLLNKNEILKCNTYANSNTRSDIFKLGGTSKIKSISFYVSKLVIKGITNAYIFPQSLVKTLILNNCHSLNIYCLRIKCPYLRNLAIYGDFDEEIDDFPSNLRKLKIEGSFNKPISKFPRKLITLSLGGKFNQFIYTLPEDLLFFRIIAATYDNYHHNCHFDKNIIDLPPKLRYVRIDSNALIYRFPKSIEYVCLGNIDLITNTKFAPYVKIATKQEYGNLSKLSNVDILTIKHIESETQIIINDPRIKRIKFRGLQNYEGDEITGINIKLPDSIEKISINNDFSSGIEYFPKNLKFIKLGNAYKENEIIIFPEGIEIIIFVGSRNRLGNLPLSLKTLKLRKADDINDVLKRNINLINITTSTKVTILPPKIILAELRAYEQKLNFEIPKTLKVLKMVNPCKIPDTVKYFYLI